MTDTIHSTVEVNGALLALDSTGSGPAVLQLHGMSSSRGQDRDMGFDFSGLSSSHRLVRYDARGHGDSRGLPDPAHYTWAHLALDLLAVKEQVSPGGPVDAIGASMGTGTILHAALAVPEAFRRLVLVIPPTAWDTRVENTANNLRAAELVEKHGLSVYNTADAAGPQPAALGDFRFRSQVSADLLPAVLRGAALTDLPEPEKLAGLTHPTLILAFPDDPGHPLSTATALESLLPDATVHTPASSPADVAAWGAVVAEFLAG